MKDELEFEEMLDVREAVGKTLDDMKEFEEEYGKLVKIVKEVKDKCGKTLVPDESGWKEWKPKDVLAYVSFSGVKKTTKNSEFLSIFQNLASV